jgi:hypothetical protein
MKETAFKDVEPDGLAEMIAEMHRLNVQMEELNRIVGNYLIAHGGAANEADKKKHKKKKR